MHAKVCHFLSTCMALHSQNSVDEVTLFLTTTSKEESHWPKHNSPELQLLIKAEKSWLLIHICLNPLFYNFYPNNVQSFSDLHDFQLTIKSMKNSK